MKKNLIPSLLFLFFFTMVIYPAAATAGSNKTGLSPVIETVRQPAQMLLAAGPSSEDEMEMEDENGFEEDVFAQEGESQAGEAVSDPLYYFNYSMYAFNDMLYYVVLKPAAIGWKAVTPTSLRKGISNFFHNLLFPVRLVNNVLQGKIGDAGAEVGIFLVNTTLGVAGIGQVAQNEFGWSTSDEDFGQTLGAWGGTHGFYIVWPVFGPSSLRDSLGMAGDYFLKPVSYIEPWYWPAAITAGETINATSFRIGDYEALKEAALDPYQAIKDAYIQNRNEKVAQ